MHSGTATASLHVFMRSPDATDNETVRMTCYFLLQRGKSPLPIRIQV